MIKIRMCIVCRNRFAQSSLLRLQIKDNRLINFTNTGRSFYLCDDCVGSKNCINTICKINKTKNNDTINLTFKEIVQQWLKSKK